MKMDIIGPRSEFPVAAGLTANFYQRRDNQSCAVDVWEVGLKGQVYTINLILPHRAPMDARWLIGSISLMRSDVWRFSADRRVQAGFKGLAYPHTFDGVTYVVFQEKGMCDPVAFVIPLADLVTGNEPSLSAEQSAQQKRAVAMDLRLPINYTAQETLAINTRVTVVDQRGGRQLLKLSNIHTGGLIDYRVVKNGEVLASGFGSLAAARVEFGHVPAAPAGNGIKTNIGGEGHEKGSTGQKQNSKQKKSK